MQFTSLFYRCLLCYDYYLQYFSVELPEFEGLNMAALYNPSFIDAEALIFKHTS